MDQIRLGPFLMDVSASRLLRNGVELELRPKAFSVLKTLAYHRGCCLDHEEMIREAWHGVWVSKHTVAVTVGELRRALREYGSWIRYRPGLGYCLDLPKSEDLIKKGLLFGNRLTKEGLEKSLLCFQQAALDDDHDSRAFAGIARCCLMLMTYGMRAPREMYRMFLEAHRRVRALNGITPEVRGNRAHGLHVFEHRIQEAESELLRALKEEPADVTNCLRLTMLYATTGRLDDALRALGMARASDALWLALPATEVVIHLGRGDFESAVECGKNAIELHPYLPLGRTLYAQALERTGRPGEALAQYRLACVMHPDIPWLRALEGTCLAKNGVEKEALITLEELQELRLTEYVDAYHMALLLDALGKRSEAFQELERAVEENSASLFLLDVDRRNDALREDPRFASLRNRVFCAPSRQFRLHRSSSDVPIAKNLQPLIPPVKLNNSPHRDGHKPTNQARAAPKALT
jgi:DNA-binding winged helix-turn-helix (wHTH) protein